MFALEETEIAKAIERARQIHPRVSVIRFGVYAVTASQGRHIVRCYRDERGQKIVDCDCQTRDGIACRCGVAVLPLHMYLATTPLATSH
jgi:3-keto-L-gulonate-6-phosphate decarboxylase